jgi:hypothetical protein
MHLMTKIQNTNMFLLFLAISVLISYFCAKNNTKILSKSEIFFSRISQYECQNIQNFKLI